VPVDGPEPRTWQKTQREGGTRPWRQPSKHRWEGDYSSEQPHTEAFAADEEATLGSGLDLDPMD
jgi:hypothetical protein